MNKFLILTRKHVLVIALTLLIIGVTIGIGVFEKAYQNRFFPNVILGGESIGGKTYDEVLSRVKLVGEALKMNGLQLVLSTDRATTTITIPQQSVGLTPDVVVEYVNLGDYEAAVRHAFEFGHSGSIGKQLRQQLSLIFMPEEIELPVTLREPAVKSLLEREFDAALKKPNDARFVRSESSIIISPESSGEQVDIDAVIAGITQALTTMRTNRLQLTVLPRPPQILRQKLMPALDFARAVGRELTLKLGYRDAEVYASGMTLATWITVKPDEAGVSLVIRRDKLADFVKSNIDGRIDDAPKNSRFAMVDDQLVETVAGVAGSVASIEETATSLEGELSKRYLGMLFPVSGNTPMLEKEIITLPVTFTKEPPQITAATIERYNIRDLVGSSTTSFKGSTAARIKNIKTGVEKTSGILIAPGAEFSLVEALGDVTEEEGYEKEYVIKGDRSVKEAGGGLCQLATTVFRGALNAGLPITERQNHSYVVGYYGPGLDATIYGPHPDLKFVNDTGNYLLFQMRVSGTNLISEFYGKKDNRVVEVTAPKLTNYISPPPDKYLPDPESPWGAVACTDHARKGLTADATYTVTYPDGKVKTQEFHSVYQPWPKICLVGIKIGAAPPAAQFR